MYLPTKRVLAVYAFFKMAAVLEFKSPPDRHLGFPVKTYRSIELTWYDFP